MDKTKIAVEVFNKHAKVYQNKFMDVSMYSESFDFFCNQLENENAEILEVACGPGNITKYLLDKRPGFKITGIDLAPNMIELAKINNPTAEFQEMDCRDIGRINKKYDAIMCGFCLPYLSKDETGQLIRDASTLLKLNGLLYISTMEDDYSKSSFKKGSSGDEIFMHFYPADFLENKLKENNFKILNVQREIYPGQDGTETTDLIIIAER